MKLNFADGRADVLRASMRFGDTFLDIEPGPRDADKTINELPAVLDFTDDVLSVGRLQVDLGLRSL